MSFLHPALLFGLVALVIPPIVHLLNRRRFEVVDWAAMQFLQISKKTRRRVLFEQILLMMLRTALIGVLVLAVASPVINLSCVERLPGGERIARLAGQSSRDIVVIVDGSFSMEYRWKDKTAHELAKEWAVKLLDDLSPGDRIAFLQAKQQPIAVVNLLTTDRSEVRSKIEGMPRPRGGVDWAKAIEESFRLLQQGSNPQKEIIILTDGQRHGWADPKSLENWELMAQGLPKGPSQPRFWVVNVVPDRPSDAPNWFISRFRTNRAVGTLGRQVDFKFDLQLSVNESTRREETAAETKDDKELPEPPKTVKFEVDGRPAGEKEPPRVRSESIGMDFTQRFSTPGSHLVSVMIDEDALPGDNRYDFAVEVLPAIPVLIVDGDERDLPLSRGSDWLRMAIAPANDPQPSFLVRTISFNKFGSQTLTTPITRDMGSIPRVLVLSNVKKLTRDQHEAIEEFLRRGGGVLAALGPRCDANSYNVDGFRDGAGWLPARLLDQTGDQKNVANSATVIAESLKHTPLEVFKEPTPESFLTTHFPRYWKLESTQTRGGNALAVLTSNDALFVERMFGKGRVIESAIPLEDAWNTNLVKIGDFIILSHELLYYLVAARSTDVNLNARAPIVFRPSDGESPGGVTIEVPEGPSRRIEVGSWPLVYEDTREAGVYRLTTDSGRVQYYVVQPDPGESNLTPCTDKDRAAVRSYFEPDRFQYETDRARIMESIRQAQDNPQLWWLFLLLVLGLLAGELFYTRRLARKSPPVMD